MTTRPRTIVSRSLIALATAALLASGTVIAVSPAAANEVPPTSPATTGASLTGSGPETLSDGSVFTLTAEGFQPNETGIAVVVYSEPVVLAEDAEADDAGVATWTGFLPRGLTGDHTLTLQGSVDRGLELTIAGQPGASALDCPADAATLSWGFNEAFRSYISSSIAKGEWMVDDGASYETPLFGWANGDGVYDGDTGEGLLLFRGSVRFVGHGGVLDTTIAHPQLRFDGDGTAVLLLGVQGDTQDGETVNQAEVEFATVDLDAAESSSTGETVEFVAAPVTLTAAGSDAFGTYPAGEALDPITVTFSTECAGMDVDPPGDEVAEQAPEAEESNDSVLWLVATLVAAAGLIALTFVLIRRRKKD